MTEQQKAEAYVYKKRPALMKHVGPKDAPKSNPGAIFTYHPINLQDWLAVLGEIGVPVEAYVLDNGLMEVEVNYEAKIYFNLTTGQPATEADYKAFNEIVSV